MRPIGPYLVALGAGALVGLLIMNRTGRKDLTAAAILGVAGAVSVTQLRKGV